MVKSTNGSEQDTHGRQEYAYNLLKDPYKENTIDHNRIPNQKENGYSILQIYAVILKKRKKSGQSKFDDLAVVSCGRHLGAAEGSKHQVPIISFILFVIERCCPYRDSIASVMG
jgi:hypothetical protein